MRWTADLRGRDADVWCANCAQIVKPKLEVSPAVCTIVLGISTVILAYVWFTYGSTPLFWDRLGLAAFAILGIGVAAAWFGEMIRSCPICKSANLEKQPPA